jgi:hypothetical protein
MSSKGGFTPSTAPTGWVFLDRHRASEFTIRWEKGIRWRMYSVVTGWAIMGWPGHWALSRSCQLGWTDLAELRTLGQRWMQAKSA